MGSSFRKYADECCPLRNVVVLSGLSGTGKTQFLRLLAELGQQTVDLECLARHSGSAFGGLGRGRQPSHRDFAAVVAAAWRTASPTSTVWIEDKASYIGSVGLPQSLQRILQAAPTVELTASMHERRARLCAQYGGIAPEVLFTALMRVAPRLGHARTDQARRALHDGRVDLAVEPLLAYYDAAYNRRTHELQRERIVRITLGDDPVTVAATATHWIRTRRRSAPCP